MRVPSFERFRKFSQLAAFFVCGMVVGAAAFNGLYHAAYSEVLQKNYELMAQIEDYRDQIQRLESDLGKESVIHSMIVFVGVPEGKPDIDVVTEKELKTRIKKDLASFRGRKIYDIGKDASFAEKLFENKIYTGIGNSDYAVRIKTILLADGVLQVWVEARVHLQP
ncbi:hypothetical protein E5161_17440 [Cohnella pontilimi]|uniref:Sporulation membrane protein YtrI C-terminal domain-containing protein n=1 Tax=Cohnella pontilimi TaxID=2564100 RepID=A0A4U0F6Z6_9BACL|nr:hypothetical protein [Cohnella pontilimi]TJY39734.1 hypothetical protein E5161_17440 [Cohnella pontilimi]